MKHLRKELEDFKAELIRLCLEIGCSMVSKNCPGSPKCSILRKIIFKEKYDKN